MEVLNAERRSENTEEGHSLDIVDIPSTAFSFRMKAEYVYDIKVLVCDTSYGMLFLVSRSRQNLSDQLRAAVDDRRRHGMSRYRICKEVRLDESTMSRFMNGYCGLALETIDALAELLGLELTAKKPKKRTKA